MSLLAQQVPDFACVTILVVENDVEPAAQALVERMALQSPFACHYVQEISPGVSNARNRALDEALVIGCDWLAFIDDDEVAEPSWLECLLRVAYQFRAEVVRGPVVYCFPAADRWAHLRDSSDKQRLRPEGQPIYEGATNNVLIAARLFAADGLALRFELALNFTGGEDKLFFMQAFQAGVTAVLSPGAVVQETVPLSRCSLRMLYRDKARLAANSIRIPRDFMGVAPDFFRDTGALVKELRHVFKALLKSLRCSLRKDDSSRRYFLQAVLGIARVHGTVLGMLGKRIEGYRQVQGN